jgi:hypothetical protein
MNIQYQQSHAPGESYTQTSAIILQQLTKIYTNKSNGYRYVYDIDLKNP